MLTVGELQQGVGVPEEPVMLRLTGGKGNASKIQETKEGRKTIYPRTTHANSSLWKGKSSCVACPLHCNLQLSLLWDPQCPREWIVEGRVIIRIAEGQCSPRKVKLQPVVGSC